MSSCTTIPSPLNQLFFKLNQLQFSSTNFITFHKAAVNTQLFAEIHEDAFNKSFIFIVYRERGVFRGADGNGILLKVLLNHLKYNGGRI